ncbi:MAG: family 78 glycoside hydrolase catalytic domain [Clostridia bacterium]|nr:family 78 glycoside hydrolase catalytic domain [Clostridia bacterium]
MEKKFISATKEYSELERHIPAPYLRRSFRIDEAAREAKIRICGLGFYILYINGKRVSKGHIAPYISNPDHVCYYDTFDVTELLSVGENVIGVILGNGFLNCAGGFIWDFDDADFRSAPMLALELSVRTDCGEITLNADGEFLTHPSPITFDDIRGGENYDARLEIEGWSRAGFDTEGWTPAIAAPTPRGKMKECTAEPIRAYREISPVSITKEGDAFIYDFGINTAGITRLRIKGERGQLVTLWHAEMLRDGKFYNDNIRFIRPDAGAYDTYNQTLRFICSGGEDVYEPHFHYSGFRYVKVEGITEEQATPELLTYLVMSSALESIGGFKCSDERLNTLFAMVKNADRSNFFYFPTDCPHREKNGWTGDASLSSDHTTLLFNTEKSYREWLYNIRCAQRLDGALPGIVPTAGWGFEWGNGPTWDSVLFNLPYTLYKYRGCTDVIRENAHAMLRYLEYVITKRSPDGTVAIGLGDWVPVNKEAHDYDAPLALTDSVMVMDMARKAAEMLGAVGMKHQAAFANGIYLDMRETVRREMVDLESLVVKGECQSSQAIALYYGVFDKGEEQGALAHLLRFIHAKDDAFDCGFIGMHCIFDVLARLGEYDLAYKMITRDSFPSYTLLIEQGHTAIPEHFFDESRAPSSYNHHFLGDIARWFMTRLAGLNVIDSRTVEIAPCPVHGIDFAQAYYDLPKGRATVRWSRDENGKVEVDYSVPTGVTVRHWSSSSEKVAFD